MRAHNDRASRNAANVRAWRAANPALYAAQRQREHAAWAAAHPVEHAAKLARLAKREARRLAKEQTKAAIAERQAHRALERAARAPDLPTRREIPPPRVSAAPARRGRHGGSTAERCRNAKARNSAGSDSSRTVSAKPPSSFRKRLSDPERRLAAARGDSTLGYRPGRVLVNHGPAVFLGARPTTISPQQIAADVERNERLLASWDEAA